MQLKTLNFFMLSGIVCKRDALSEVVSDDEIVDVDNDLVDPQACATIACDIYKHLRASEVRNLFLAKVDIIMNLSWIMIS